MISSCLKAVVAALIAGLSFAIPVADNGLTVPEVLGALLAALVGFSGTYWVKNRPSGDA